MNLWDDPRIVRGMTAQFALRRQRLDGADTPLGWKVGFGTPAQLKQFNITGPLVGFLTQNARVAPGGTVSLAGWVKPVAESEIAVHIGRDVTAGTRVRLRRPEHKACPGHPRSFRVKPQRRGCTGLARA